MRRAAALLVAALLAAGCGGPDGFSAQAPGGWTDETGTANLRSDGAFEVVYEGPAVEGVLPTLAVSRVRAGEGATAAGAARAARSDLRRQIEGSEPTPAVETELAGEPAARFDYRAGEKRSRYVTARHGDHLYAVTVQAHDRGFTRAVEVLDDYLDSWRWAR